MLNITVREANESEKLNIDDECEKLPNGVVAFDSCMWEAVFFMCLGNGDYVVEIADNGRGFLNSQMTGNFIISRHNDGGYLKSIPPNID